MLLRLERILLLRLEQILLRPLLHRKPTKRKSPAACLAGLVAFLVALLRLLRRLRQPWVVADGLTKAARASVALVAAVTANNPLKNRNGG